MERPESSWEPGEDEHESESTDQPERGSGVAPKAGAGGLEHGARAVLGELQAALLEVLTATGKAIRQPRDVKAALGIHPALAWKVHRFVSGSNLLADACHLPGKVGISTFLEAAAAWGVSQQRRDRVALAFDRFRALVKNQGGDRASLELMLAGLGAGDAAPDLGGRSTRRAGFNSNSAVWGTQMRLKFLSQITAPSDRPDLLDFVVVRGFVGMRRLREGASLSIMPLSLINGERAAPARQAINALDPGGVYQGLSLLPRFCSDPLPEIVVGKNQQGIPEHQLGYTRLGGREGATIVAADLFRRAGLRYRTESNSHGNTALSIRQPIEHVVLDIWTHKDVLTGTVPEARLYSGTSGVSPDDQSAEHPDLLPMPERVERLGPGLHASHIIEFLEYRTLMQFAFEAAGWDPSQFVLHRLRMDYPAMPTSMVMRFDLAEKPVYT